MGSFVIPKIMKFTVLPFKLMAKAWIDPQFEEELLRNPKPFLLEQSLHYPRTCQYLILRDTKVIKHFVLPVISDELLKLDDESLLGLIRNETGNDRQMDEFLPAEIILKGARDENFVSDLIKNPTKILEKFSKNLQQEVRVIKNSTHVYHVPLRYNF